jgi:hypothetical protein
MQDGTNDSARMVTDRTHKIKEKKCTNLSKINT